MRRSLVTRTSVRVRNSFVRFLPADAAVIPICLLTLGLIVVPAPAAAQTASQAFMNLFSGARLYVDPASAAKRQADAWRRTRPTDAELMDRIASQPVAQWLGGGERRHRPRRCRCGVTNYGVESATSFCRLQHPRS